MSTISLAFALLTTVGLVADVGDDKPQGPRSYLVHIRVETTGADGKQLCLAAPTLVVKEGKEALFMAGGELPCKIGKDKVAHIPFGLSFSAKVASTTDTRIRAEIMVEHSKAADVTGAVFTLPAPPAPPDEPLRADPLPQGDGDMTLRSRALRISRELQLGKTLVIVERLAEESPPYRILVTFEESKGMPPTGDKAPIPVRVER